MPEWIPTFTLPNITLTETIESEGIALVSTADPVWRKSANRTRPSPSML
jgi:hypothetical protein